MQLEDFNYRLVYWHVSDFNLYKVQLEEGEGEILVTAPEKFQSLQGAIRSAVKIVYHTNVSIFQSLQGAIRSSF